MECCSSRGKSTISCTQCTLIWINFGKRVGFSSNGLSDDRRKLTGLFRACEGVGNVAMGIVDSPAYRLWVKNRFPVTLLRSLYLRPTSIRSRMMIELGRKYKEGGKVRGNRFLTQSLYAGGSTTPIATFPTPSHARKRPVSIFLSSLKPFEESPTRFPKLI